MRIESLTKPNKSFTKLSTSEVGVEDCGGVDELAGFLGLA